MSSLIENFFDKKCILITGATGFLGKVLLFKLLSSCSRISTIFILIRSRKSKNSQQRLKELIECQVFDSLRNSDPDCFKKIVPISGDITFEHLGINSNEFKILVENVSIVFNVAATIRFDEPLKRAVDINVKGTNRVLKLCHQIKNFKALIHVSTAFFTKVTNNIKETIYQESMSPKHIMEASDWMDEQVFSSLSDYLLAGRPTSYHYTKSLAENLLFQEKKDLSVAIIRPSIIVAAYREPFPGWIDNHNGPSGFILTLGKGILRTLHGHQENISDIIPVDIVANCMIVAAFQIGKEKTKEPLIVNCTSGTLNPITWGQIKDISIKFLVKYPTQLIFRYPSCHINSNRFIHLFLLHLEHNLPAFLIDLLFKATGHKPFLTQIYKKVHRSLNALEHFTINEWTWENQNFLSLINSLGEKDRDIFPIDIRKINWVEFMESYVLGVRKFLCNENLSNLEKSRKNLNKIYYCTQFVKLILVARFAHQILSRYLLPRIKKQLH